MNDIKVVKIVGLTFHDDYPANLLRLADSMGLDVDGESERGDRDEWRESHTVVLMREPDNRYDPNAIAVHIPALDQQVGHIPRKTAEILAPMMDDDVPLVAWVTWVRIDPDHTDRPGLDIAIERKEREELF
jgi:hypothetical protein